LPIVAIVNTLIIQQNYLQIKRDIDDMQFAEIDKLNGDPEKVNLKINRNTDR
jgi:hypothetical protein